MRSGGSSRSKTSIRRAKSRMPHIKAPRAHNKTRAHFMLFCLPENFIELKQLWPETVPGDPCDGHLSVAWQGASATNSIGLPFEIDQASNWRHALTLAYRLP